MQMEEKNKLRANDLLSGILLCCFFLSLAFSISAVFFSEMKNIVLSLNLMLVLSFVSASVYALLECLVFSKNRSSAFSIGYFGTLVICSASVFFIASVVPMNYIFDLPSSYTAAYLKTACVRFCLFNAAALIVRLGAETYRYLKASF